MERIIPRELAEVVRRARTVAVLTGAGVSAESGIPTFRDAQKGMWARFSPAQLATPEAFARDPARVAAWYDERRLAILQARPNPAHRALAQWADRLWDMDGTLTLVTQNVDRLHQAAGSHMVVELHGNLLVWRCIRCGEEREERGPAFPEHPPRCPCGGIRRPGVVWFGEDLPADAWAEAQRAAGTCALFVTLGTSAVVQPAATLLDHARAGGARTLEINLEPTPATEVVDWSLLGPAGTLLPALLAAAG